MGRPLGGHSRWNWVIEHYGRKREMCWMTPHISASGYWGGSGDGGVMFEGTDVELSRNMLKLRGLWDAMSGVHRALVHWPPSTFRALRFAWNMCFICFRV